MSNKVMVLGGYGNFGKRIVRGLTAKNIDVLIVGRNAKKAKMLADEIGPRATPLSIDIPDELSESLTEHRPDVIVNTVGPFQQQDYHIARIAIAHGIHYIDLADGREFVCGIGELDDLAKSAGIAVITGASTVPALSDAVLSEYQDEFSSIEKMKYGIAPGQGAERGLATTKAILSYVGKPLSPFPAIREEVFGWQDLYRQPYPGLGSRWMANCDIPDLGLLPQRYGLKSIQFSAGLELGLLHLTLWGLSWLVRSRLPIDLPKFAAPLLAASDWFDAFGSSDGGMHVILKGRKADEPEKTIERHWYVIARDGDGPHIPTIPSILLASRIANGDMPPAGAYPCLGLISLPDYLSELEQREIEVVTECRPQN